MRTHVRVEGLRELDAALTSLADEYGKNIAKSTVRRVLRQSIEPMAETARELAPDDPATGGNDLKRSIAVGSTLNKRQARLARKDQGRAKVTVYMGTADPAGVFQEFGTVNHGPQPFMRPAFDRHAEGTLRSVGRDLGPEIEKSAERAGKRRAAKAAGA